MFQWILAAILLTVNADFNLKPHINEAMIGGSTHFDCTTATHTNEVNWYHYRVGAKDYEDNCIYFLGQIHPQYKNRYEVERLLRTDIYRLRIKSVQWEDAGMYVCQDNGGIGESLSAQLVVLVSVPICLSNMKPDGLLGPNDCNMEPDVLQMSCNVSYHGNISPIIQWREVHSVDPIERGVSWFDTGHQMTCKLALNARLGLNGSSYVCETRTSALTKYNCSSDVINIIHVNIDNSSTEMVYDTKQSVACLANSSQPCSYSWKWVDGVHEEVVSNSSTLTPSKAGWHKCEARCTVRGKQCLVLSKVVYVDVSEPTIESNSMLMNPLIIAIVLIVNFTMVITAIIYLRKRKRHRWQNQALSENKNFEQTEPFLQVAAEPKLTVTLTPNAAFKRKKAVFGMTILGDELFVLSYESPKLEVYANLQKLEFKRDFELTGSELEVPWDIQSCSGHKCLYIVDNMRDEDKFTEIIKIDPLGNVQIKWTTECIAGRLSVTNEFTVIVTSLYVRMIREFSTDGYLIRFIYLPSNVGFGNPWVTLKRNDNEYIISHGNHGDKQHRVCICDNKGNMKHYFGGSKGLSNHQLDVPVHMAAYSDGHLLVADKNNSRVLLLSPDLKFLQAISLSHGESSRFPNRICLDEENKRMFVSNNQWISNMKPWNDGRVSVFDMSSVQARFKIASDKK